MSSLLAWLVPPLAGALIGYVTNAVAIKMLFRPLKPVLIFGRRLPFTPGILPRQRHKLADSIGSMVNRELLTAEILNTRLHRADVREGILRSVARFTERLLSSPIENFSPPPPPAFPEGKAPEEESPGGLLARLILEFIGSPVFEALLDRVLAALSASFGRRTLRDILGDSVPLEDALERIIRKGLDEAAPALMDLFDREMEGAFPVIEASFIRFLKQKDIRGELETRGRIFLNKTFLRLNVFQRFFISAGQYDRTLHERMPEIVDDLIAQMEEILGNKQLNLRFLSFLREQSYFLLKGQTASLEKGLSRIVLSYADLPLEDLILQWTHTGPEAGGTESGEPLKDLGRRLLSRIKENGEMKTKIRLAVDAFLETHRGMSLSDLLSIDNEKKQALDALITSTFLRVADEQIEPLLASINIRTLVSDRIDALEMIKVERIVLDVMANQLKWINLFGALLGALIGLFQTFFSRFIH